MLIFNRAAALAERLKIHLLGCCEMVAAVGAVRRGQEQTDHLELLVLPRLPENDAKGDSQNLGRPDRCSRVRARESRCREHPVRSRDRVTAGMSLFPDKR